MTQDIVCGEGEKKVGHGAKSNRGDHPALESGEIPQTEEGGKDGLHQDNTRTPPTSSQGTTKKRKTTNVVVIQEHRSQVYIPSSLT
jgi:hypothetical protein